MTDQATIEEFRAEVDAFFSNEENTTLDPSRSGLERAQQWQGRLFDAGLGAINYPTEFGGRGLSADHAQAFAEVSRGKIPRETSVFGISIGMALPTIRDFASDELKQRFLAPGLRGEEIWCQLYSEPGAGSDLAALTTKATLDGDEWIVTGQKVWTSGAEHSQFGILIARTDNDAPKHRGITMMVIPMEQPGVTVRPLVQMTGEAEFNEVFMDEARIPKSWVIGEVNDGWRTAVALLAHERVQTGTASMNSSTGQRSKSAEYPFPSGN